MECPGMPVIGSREFGLKLREKFAGRRIPFGGGWELTLRCSLRCEHCYAIYGTPKSLLPYEEVCRVADELVSEGTLGVFLTGGEIMTRPDFTDIYLFLKRRGLLVTLFTNAVNVNREIARALREYPPVNVEVSIYGASAETYEKVARIPGSFARFARGIGLLKEAGVPLVLKTVVTHTNVGEFDEMKKAAERIGAKFRWDPHVTARMTGDAAPCAFRLAPAEVISLEKRHNEEGKSWVDLFRATRDFCSPERPELFTCGAGRNTFFIDAQGKLHPCLMVREEAAYDLRTGTFREGFRSLGEYRRRPKTEESPCHGCGIKPLCHGCPGFSYWEHRSLERPVDYLCELSHLRYREFVEERLEESERPCPPRRETGAMPAPVSNGGQQ